MSRLIKESQKYLEAILLYDWNKFNSLSFHEQLKSYHSIINEFQSILNKYQCEDYLMLNKIFESYYNKFKNLNIDGKSKHVFPPKIINNGGLFILHKLQNILKDIEFKKLIESSDDRCDCKLAIKFDKQPRYDNFKYLGWINDKYYLPKIYKCRVCSSEWISYTSDDDLGQIIWEILPESYKSDRVLTDKKG